MNQVLGKRTAIFVMKSLTSVIRSRPLWHTVLEGSTRTEHAYLEMQRLAAKDYGSSSSEQLRFDSEAAKFPVAVTAMKA